MRTFQLIRETPGPSAAMQVTEIVAEAVVYSDGLAVLHWLTDPAGTEVYPAPDGEILMRQVRERSGRSQFRETGRLDLRAAPGYLAQGAASGQFRAPEVHHGPQESKANRDYAFNPHPGRAITTPGGADRGDLP
jgi:hypothetical protein